MDKNKKKEYRKKYYLRNKEKINQWCLKNKDKIKEYKKKFYLKNKDKIKQYYQKNKEKLNEHARQYIAKRKTYDKNFLIRIRLRDALYQTLKNYTEGGKTMSSNKYGIDYKAIIKKLTPLPFPISERKNWHIDHKRPCKSFDLTNPDEVKQCFTADNLQWLPARENRIKGDKYPIIKV